MHQRCTTDAKRRGNDRRRSGGLHRYIALPFGDERGCHGGTHLTIRRVTVENDSSVESRIAEALARRHSQREFVQRLGEVWRALVDDLEEIADALAVTDDELRNISPSADVRRRIGNSLALVLRSSADDGSSLGELRRRAAETDRAVRAVHARVHRDSVNLAVVGVTRSGKSTLLRSITGLGTRRVCRRRSTTRRPPRPAASITSQDPSGPSVNLHDWTSFRDYLPRTTPPLGQAGADPPHARRIRGPQLRRPSGRSPGAALRREAAHRHAGR